MIIQHLVHQKYRNEHFNGISFLHSKKSLICERNNHSILVYLFIETQMPQLFITFIAKVPTTAANHHQQLPTTIPTHPHCYYCHKPPSRYRSCHELLPLPITPHCHRQLPTPLPLPPTPATLPPSLTTTTHLHLA